MPKITQTDHFARLPNELLESVLKRFEVQILIPLRLVNPRWNVIIESMCHKQKSLALMGRDSVVKLQDRFDGQVDLNRLVTLKLKQMDTNSNFESTVGDLRTLLCKLFPNVENLFVDRITVPEKSDFLVGLFSLWSSSLVTLYLYGKIIFDLDSLYQICSQINAMTNLRNLNLSTENRLPLKSLAPTLARLYSFSFCLSESPQFWWNELVNHLGPHCTQLKVNVHSRGLSDLVVYWNSIRIAQSPITHLHLNAFVPQFQNIFYRVLPGHFVATLKSFHITNSRTDSSLISAWNINPFMSHFTQLTDIRIDGPTHFRLSVFCYRDGPTPMPNIRSFSLYNFRFYCNVINREEMFCDYFSTIFPNLERLILHYQDFGFGEKIRPFLDLFKALRYHDISCDW